MMYSMKSIQNGIMYLLNFITRYWAWGIRFALIFVVIQAIAPPSSYVQFMSQQTVITEQAHVCVHTRLIDEVEEWIMQKSLIDVREMGATTIVEFFPWAYIERAQGVYDWAQADKIIAHAQNQGVKVIARMGFVPDWVREDIEEATTFNYLPDDAFDEFAEFVALFADRYAGTVSEIIIWNEPNLAFEWGYRPVDPQAYTRLLQTVYVEVKAVQPNTRILAGALAPTLESEESPNGLNDVLYLTAMYEAGAKGHFDALAVHTYGFTHPARQAPAIDRLNFRRVELLREVMESYDDSHTPIIITESGWNDNPRWTQSVSPSERIQYTIEALQLVENDWDWAESMCIWALRYPRPTYSYPDNFTLITSEFQYKPIYYAIQDYARGWQESETLWLEPPQ